MGKFLDEEWIIVEIQERWFKVSNPLNGYFVTIGHDARRGWEDDFSKQDEFKRGIIMLKAQVILEDGRSRTEPLTDSMLTEAMKRVANQR